MPDFEKLGVFYLGRLYDIEQRKAKDELLLYDSRDLVTHAVCIGMTGSGKTGLCIALLEEAAIDGIPAIVIDPKGDLGNLLLTFPELRAEDFRPWIGPEEDAARQAETWRRGLAEWGQDGARVRRMKDAAEFAIYTPGSSAGLPVSILSSFAAPPPGIAADRELLRERVNAAATSLLGLAGIEADPIRSREHILLATVLDHAWRAGRGLDLAGIIQAVQNPPVNRIGALDLDAFYPPQERFALVMALNNVLAAPGFESWMEGEPLDIGRILYTAAGKPRVAVFSIAHLADNERMFFVSLLLSQTLAWMRAQSGTTSLRALVYMDEIFGYFPPVANPPSKQPLLTLLKQARAFGLGVVLATQNPVDLDYKGLANAGTWFIGRLQTERDKARVLDGLEGVASTHFDRQRVDRTLSGLGSRVFLLHNVHEDAPAVFQTRWTLSYLRGPLTRDEIRRLATTPAAPAPPHPAAVPAQAAAGPPALPPDVPQHYLPLRSASAGAALLYRPMLLGAAQVNFPEANYTDELLFLTPVTAEAVPVNWGDSTRAGLAVSDLETEPAPEARYADLPPAAARARSYAAWSRDFAAWLYQSHKLRLLKSPATGMTSAPGEAERDFRIRLRQVAREQRDEAVGQLRRKYAPKTAVLQDRIRRAEQAVERETEQAGEQKLSTALSVGATLLGAFLGRKAVSASTVGRAASAARSAGRLRREQQDIERASETVAALQQRLAELEAEFQSEVAAAEAASDPLSEALETVEVRLKKANISVRLVALAWAPYRQAADGSAAPAW